MSAKQQFSCLYTKHKIQKRRVWHDGRLVVSGGRARLYSAHPTSADPLLDECDFSATQEMETERFLIQVEGPWVEPTTLADAPSSNTTGTSSGSILPKVHQLRKFQRPRRTIPPPPRPNHWDTVLGKRKRPLQPGELERLHYGNNATSGGRSHARPLGQPTASMSHALPRISHHQHDNDYLHTTLQHPHRHTCLEEEKRLIDANNAHPLVRQQQSLPLASARNLHSELGFAYSLPSTSSPMTPAESTHPLKVPHEITSPQEPLPESSIVPDAFVLQVAELPPKSARSVSFVSNEFNVNEYYGFEEEEDEEDTELCTTKNNPLTATFLNVSHNTTDNVPTTSEPFQENNTLYAPTKSRSTNELLALFGAAPIIPTTTDKEATKHHAVSCDESNDEHSDGQSKENQQVRFYLPSPANSESSVECEK